MLISMIVNWIVLISVPFNLTAIFKTLISNEFLLIDAHTNLKPAVLILTFFSKFEASNYDKLV